MKKLLTLETSSADWQLKFPFQGPCLKQLTYFLSIWHTFKTLKPWTQDCYLSSQYRTDGNGHPVHTGIIKQAQALHDEACTPVSVKMYILQHPVAAQRQQGILLQLWTWLGWLCKKCQCFITL